MFSKLMHLLSSMVGNNDESTQQVSEKLQMQAENSFLYEITNGRPDGLKNSDKIISGHKKIGDFIHRGIQIQQRKIQQGV